MQRSATRSMSRAAVLLIHRDTAPHCGVREREREVSRGGGGGQRLREDSEGRKNVVNYSPIAEMDGVLPSLCPRLDPGPGARTTRVVSVREPVSQACSITTLL